MFPVQEMEERLREIRKGNSLAREDFLEDCKPFIFKVACRFCGRILDWGRDDELAVALIAFNEAIDRFREDADVPFPAYARMVINSRLADYRRKEGRNAAARWTLPLHPDVPDDTELNRAWEVYWEEAADREREEEIKEYEGLLKKYGVSFEDLVKCSPRHRDTRETLIRAALALVENGELFAGLLSKKKLPLAELAKSTGISRKILERGRKYIIATALLIYRREDFLYLSSYLNLPAPGKKEV